MSQLRRFLGIDEQALTREDQVLPVTRWVGRILVPVLAVAAVILYGFPDRTTELFAWTIRPDMTPILMGAGYGVGAYFFYRVATHNHWHEVALIFPGISVFTWFMLLATLLHWENFNHDHVTFWIWVFIYVVAPFLVPAIWLLNRRTDPRVQNRKDPSLPKIVRQLSGLTGLLITGTAIVLFFFPSVLIAYWPWDVSPLTARILLGWFALFGVVNLAVAFESRLSAVQIVVQTQVIGFGLVLLGAGLAWNDFDVTNPLTWGFIGGFVIYLVVIVSVFYKIRSPKW
ncbi:hypothetical protein ACLI4U_09790 [Natrialbaceae archaeon A-CW2]|uniref:hypothetical protein n=1 Tax=Natronosalvus amylolyticus TaxID=2961994 RepID=UPI0020C9C414|nr:hypothetical protein [Natronosalvus amylolyticus]